MTISRRKFLKGAGAAAVGASLFISGCASFPGWARRREGADVELKASLCNMCSSHCGMWVHVKNGRPWKVTGNKDETRSRGKLCGRAHASFALLYDNGRVKTPLKKVNGNFVPVSWEQATDEIGAKLRAVMAAGESKGIFWKHNPRATGLHYGPRLMHAVGSNTIMTTNPACNNAMIAGYIHTVGGYPWCAGDMPNAKYILATRNYGDGIRTDQAIEFGDYLRNPDTKIVIIDPRLSVTASLADEWLPIRPGTDLAFFLAICHVLIRENLYDRAFIAERTEGFDAFAATVGQYTPEWAEEKTTISAGTIRRIAREMAALAPAVFVDPGWKGGFGDNFENGTETARVVAYVNTLLGAWGQPGGLPHAFLALNPSFGALDPARHPNPPIPTTPRLDGQGIPGEFPLAPPQGVIHNVIRKARLGIEPVKVGFLRHCNTLRNHPGYEELKEGMEKIEMLIVMDHHMSESATVASFVLPEPTFLEREEIVEAHDSSVITRSVCIPKMHPETKPLDEIVTLIAQKAGVGQYFNYTLRDLNRARLAPLGITLEELHEKGAINVPTVPVPLPFLPKVLFHSDAYVAAGQPGVAGWVEPLTGYLPPTQNHFRPVMMRQGYHTHVSTADNPYLAQITIDYKTERAWINAARARALGINDNDMIEITTDYASVRARAFVTEKIHPEVIAIPSHYGKRSPYLQTVSARTGGINTNDMLPSRMETISGHSMMQEMWATVRRV